MTLLTVFAQGTDVKPAIGRLIASSKPNWRLRRGGGVRVRLRPLPKAGRRAATRNLHSLAAQPRGIFAATYRFSQVRAPQIMKKKCAQSSYFFFLDTFSFKASKFQNSSSNFLCCCTQSCIKVAQPAQTTEDER